MHCLEAELKINIIRPLRAKEGGNEMDFSRAGLNNRARARGRVHEGMVGGGVQ